jgi:poly(A) polymerase
METTADPRSKPPCDRNDALAVVKRLREQGHVAYFAGGCVRDALLGLNPKDYDVATDAPPERVRKLFPRTQAVGAAFGVILVKQGRSTVEVATFRTDGRYLDGRRPEGVTFTTAEEDAKRRDFTINGLFFDPLEDRVIDFVGGQEDLKARRLRAIGQASHRFEEDHLRLLRAVRFAARFDLEIEPSTADAIRRSAARLKGISPERIADELRLMLTPTTRVAAWRILWEFKLMQVILRTLPEQPTAPPVPALFPALVPNDRLDFGVALAALVLCYRAGAHPSLAMFETAEIRRSVQVVRTALRVSNEELDLMAETLDIAALLHEQPPTVAMMKRFLAKPASGGARILLSALHAVGSPYKDRIVWLRDQLAKFEKTDFAPLPLITGDDLTAAGFQPGPVFKRVLDAVYDAQLEGRISSKEDAMGMSLSLLRYSGGG